jgi:hypothetical protein
MKDIEYAPNDRLFDDWDIKTTHDTYEVKYDRWHATTFNILIETYSDREANSLGWFFKTKADWLIVFYTDDLFFGVSMEHLRDCFFDKPRLWRKVDIVQENGHTTVCWVAPIESLTFVKYGDVRKVRGESVAAKG